MAIFPRVRIREVATPVERPETPIPGQIYRQIGVRLWGQGAYERESLDGSQTRYATLSRVETDDIVVNKIWARNGSVAVVSEYLAGCYGSGEFPTFAPHRDKLLPRWFQWLTKTQAFWQQCDEKSQGTSGKNRIRPEQFLNVEIPLPPLAEQQRIAARIEALARRVEEARGLRREAGEEAETLFKAELHGIFESLNHSLNALGDFATQITDGPHITPQYMDTGVPFVTVRNIADRRLDLTNLKYISQKDHEEFCRRIKPERGDVLYTKDGTLGTPCYVDTDAEFSFFVSVALIKPIRDQLDGRYLAYILDAPQVHDQVAEGKTGAVLAHIVLRAIKAIRIPIPPLKNQHRIVTYLDNLKAKADDLRRLQAETQKELDAMMPSILAKAFAGEL
jgi:type I restriction enzyme S subunit